MKSINFKKDFLSFVIVVLSALSVTAQQALWVGQSYTFDVSSSVMGITANMSWSTSGGYLSLSGSGFYRTITVTQYFSGTATVTCEWDYKLTGNGSYTHTKREVTISCRDNQVSISPTSMTMSPGEIRYVNYRHQYNNEYASAAHAYFQSSDPSICSVSATGEVVANNPGTAYINVYSKISSVSPYCKVTVKQVEPTSISIPSTITMVAGETRTLTPTLYPSNAQTSYSWTSSDTQVATVSSTGIVTAKKQGTAIISVRTTNGLTASCSVRVNKAKLTLSVSHLSQLLQSGTEVTLTASAPNSNIYYTTNGDIPTSKSLLYTQPLVISDKSVIKAIAFNEDYLDSDILTLNYDVTKLFPDYTIPSNNSNISWNNFAFTIVYNMDIDRGKNIDDIIITDISGKEISSTFSIANNTLSIVPSDGFHYNTYKVNVPSYAVQSVDGQNSNVSAVYTFTNVESTEAIIAMAVNGAHSFILKSDGSLWAFGSNNHGQLGDGTKTNRYTPVKIMDDVKTPIAGWCFGLAIKNDNTLWSWGSNYDGNLGDGTTTDRLSPIKIKGNIVFAESDSWSRCHAIDTDEHLWAWGENTYGNLGDGTTTNRRSPIKLGIDNIQYATGGPHSAAIDIYNNLYMWGNNNKGQLADGTTTYRKSPIKVMAGIKKVCTAYCSTYILDVNGDLWTCGDNGYGQLGTGNKTSYSTPQKILEGIEKIYSFSYGGFAINKKHELYVWGNISSLFWHTLGKTVLLPQIIMDNVEEVACGYSHALIKRTDGSIWGVGQNDVGQLGCITEANTIYEPIILFPGQSPALDSIYPVFDDVTFVVGDIFFLPFNISPGNAGLSDVIWSSSNDCLLVREDGFIEAIKAGKATITCNVTDKYNNSYSCSFNVDILEKVAYVPAVSADASNETIEYYDISGVKLNPINLTSGIYILKQGDRVQKIIIK